MSRRPTRHDLTRCGGAKARANTQNARINASMTNDERFSIGFLRSAAVVPIAAAPTIWKTLFLGPDLSRFKLSEFST